VIRLLYILGAIYIKVLFRRTIFSIVTMLASHSVTKTAKPSTIKPEHYPVLILSASSCSMIAQTVQASTRLWFAARKQQSSDQETTLFTQVQRQAVGCETQTAPVNKMFVLRWCDEDYSNATRTIPISTAL